MKKAIMFRSKTTGRLVSFMTDAEGNSWRGDGTGRITLRPKGTDIVVRGSIAQRDRNGPGKKLKPRTDRTAHIAGMESASRMGGTKPANPAQLLRVGEGHRAEARQGQDAAPRRGGLVRLETRRKERADAHEIAE